MLLPFLVVEVAIGKQRVYQRITGAAVGNIDDKRTKKGSKWSAATISIARGSIAGAAQEKHKHAHTQTGTHGERGSRAEIVLIQRELKRASKIQATREAT